MDSYVFGAVVVVLVVADVVVEGVELVVVVGVVVSGGLDVVVFLSSSCGVTVDSGLRK